ncbi:deoxyribose-phosphate aldolase [Lacticaseibacillus saniviri]|uniref:Deoxyribose-phosphate aldolase n=1 Tax=Lacticaseibacillus saniviri JCM 17471 = DSM 24301 TaxID=1293598 RepID=A0A0R2MZ54_9LACO|nr:deoxyribose-phosphate aldolase [Lacticaseibacillus saniviri]KRO18855.1 deoxyribose-phosphate aldolase [Lacticaseibacillus saniviri JCM 17471 = DSM 24301]MCG4281432.1 deoxyribose-phosphate aldolase [Lacticaseibacillus saniviri]
MDKPLAKYIDHTLLKPDATQDQIDVLLEEAKQYDFASVCVNPYWVERSAAALKDSDVEVCTVIGFPLGANQTALKVAETEMTINAGAQEVDMVINIGELKAGHDEQVQADIHAVAEAAHQHQAILKVIIEAVLLTDDEKVRACELSEAAGADFVKTSTGFAAGGATVHDVALMRATVGDRLGVKAAGGIHTYAEAKALIEAGASRLGASAGVAILKEAEAAK